MSGEHGINVSLYFEQICKLAVDMSSFETLVSSATELIQQKQGKKHSQILEI